MVVLITIGFLSSNTANSYYNSNSNIPVVDMMLTMMDMMARVMRGDRLNKFSGFPYSPNPYGGLPMSPAYLYGSPFNSFSPWSKFSSSNPFEHNPIKDVSPDNDENEKTSFFGTNLDKVWESMEGNIPGLNNSIMNGIWQAMSGDIIAIYKDNYFIWTDGNRRHLAGSIMIKGKQMVAYIPANKRYLRFQFYREDNKFAVRDTNGQIYLFKKIH